MDIKSLDESLTVRFPVSQSGNLLAQLKAAGTIEAEVIRVLQDKLLLSSRLGEILTSNSLNYKAGDQLNIRLAGSDLEPVLKVSPRQSGPVTLDSNQIPRLSRLVPVNGAVLAIVTSVAPPRIQIRLADQILTLPRQPGIARDQLLSLQRNNANQKIEIKPVDRKLIYKAMLKQLVPGQPETGSKSLVRLLNLVNKVTGSPTSQAAPVNSRVTDTFSGGNSGAVSRAVTAAVTNQASTSPGKTGGMSIPENLNRSGDIKTPRPPAETAFNGTRTESRPAQTGNNRQITALLRQINKQGNPPVERTPVTKPDTSRSGLPAEAARPIIESHRQGSAVTGNQSVNIAATSTGKTVSLPVAPAASSTPTETPATIPDARQRVVSQTPRTSGNASQATAVPVPGSGSGTLQMLLQWVPRIAELNVTQIKQWFEFASLIRAPRSRSTLSTTPDPVRSLNRLMDQATFSRELDQALQLKIKAAAGDDAPPARTPQQEMLQQYARDGVKLIEQSLTQNLLQRATLGMQQETLQPLSLSLVLPFLEKQDIKPIQIDLSQRGESMEDGDNGWDIRLSFEFADLGPISCHLFLEGQAVAASFYSEQDQTRNQIEQALPELEQQLRSAGFTNCEFHSFPATLAKTEPVAKTAYSESLIDIEV